MNRLVNVLNGFDERVIIKIADSDTIENVIIMLKGIHQFNGIKRSRL